ncbi:MAG: hypothetical protein U5K69_09900 [Balneolaceae bacterium]|nr:hypothetical protein [Balneolaceae bacterium]
MSGRKISARFFISSNGNAITETYQLIVATLAAVVLFLFLFMLIKMIALIVFMLASMGVGHSTGKPEEDFIPSIEQGMGGRLGFVATMFSCWLKVAWR